MQQLFQGKLKDVQIMSNYTFLTHAYVSNIFLRITVFTSL